MIASSDNALLFVVFLGVLLVAWLFVVSSDTRPTKRWTRDVKDE